MRIDAETFHGFVDANRQELERTGVLTTFHNTKAVIADEFDVAEFRRHPCRESFKLCQ
jgi:hypothetical protein